MTRLLLTILGSWLLDELDMTLLPYTYCYYCSCCYYMTVDETVEELSLAAIMLLFLLKKVDCMPFRSCFRCDMTMPLGTSYSLVP